MEILRLVKSVGWKEKNIFVPEQKSDFTPSNSRSNALQRLCNESAITADFSFVAQ